MPAHGSPILTWISDGEGKTFPEWCKRRFCGFRSLWTTPLDCKVNIAEAENMKRKILQY